MRTFLSPFPTLSHTSILEESETMINMVEEAQSEFKDSNSAHGSNATAAPPGLSCERAEANTVDEI